MAFAAVAAFGGEMPTFEYFGALEAAPAAKGSTCVFTLPDGKTRCRLVLAPFTSQVTTFTLSADGGRTWGKPFPAPVGLTGLAPAAKAVDGERVMIAFSNPKSVFRGHAMNMAWIGPWASLAAGTKMGFYAVKSPNGTGAAAFPDVRITDERNAKEEARRVIEADLTVDDAHPSHWPLDTARFAAVDALGESAGSLLAVTTNAFRSIQGRGHVAVRLSDGRDLIVFASAKSLTPHVYGWIGPREEVLKGSGENGYRVKLIHNFGGLGDGGLPAVRTGKDGEISVTASVRRGPADAKPGFLLMKFRIGEADALRDLEIARCERIRLVKERGAGARDVQTVWVPFAGLDKFRPLTKAKVYGTVFKRQFIVRTRKGGHAPPGSFTERKLIEKFPHLVREKSGVVGASLDLGDEGESAEVVLGTGKASAPTSSNGVLDLNAQFKVMPNALLSRTGPVPLAFIVWEVETREAHSAELAICNSGRMTVYVNGRCLLEEEDRKLGGGRRIAVELKAGKNEILLASTPAADDEWTCAAAIGEAAK